MADDAIIETVRAYLRRLAHKGLDVGFAVLFGSHLEGQPHEWSDIDLVVVSSRFDVTKRREDIDLLWVAAMEVDARIEPIACGVQEWADGDERAVIESARRTGRAICPAA